MAHLADGALRRLLDEGPGDDAQQSHIAGCAACRSKLAAFAGDAAWTADEMRRALPKAESGTESDGDYDSARAWRMLSTRLTPRRTAPISRSWLIAAGAAAALAAVLAFTPVGTLAQNFLTIFEPEQFVAVPVNRTDLVTLPDLARFGTMTQRIAPRVREVAGPAAAGALAGIAVETPAWLPQGTPADVTYAVTSGSDSTFTFSAQKAWAAESLRERATAPMPRALDGAVLELRTRPAVIIAYGVKAENMNANASHRTGDRRNDEDGRRQFPPLVIIQAPVPSVTSNGATVAEIESYLLRQPGVSPTLAAQIRAIGDPTTTVPIPIPIDRAFGQPVRVQGVQGLGIGDDTGVGGLVIWQRNGLIYGVAGQLRQRDILAIAESMR